MDAKTQRLLPSDQLVLAALKSMLYAGQGLRGETYFDKKRLRVKAIAHKANRMPLRTLYRCLDRLAAAGKIQRVELFNKDRGTAHQYGIVQDDAKMAPAA